MKTGSDEANFACTGRQPNERVFPKFKLKVVQLLWKVILSDDSKIRPDNNTVNTPCILHQSAPIFFNDCASDRFVLYLKECALATKFQRWWYKHRHEDLPPLIKKLFRFENF